MLLSEDRAGQDAPQQVSLYPIYLAAVQQNEEGEKYSLCFNNKVPSKGWQEIIIGAGELHGHGGRGKLAELGANIVNMDYFKTYTGQAQKMLSEQGLLTRYEQFGWKKDGAAFVVGDRIYEGGSHKPAAGAQVLIDRAKFLGPRPKGSLSEWTLLCNRLFREGQEAQSFALLASFAAPFMKLHQYNEGGAIISLSTPESGRGKSTALEAVSSVWGLHDGIRITNRDTINAKDIMLGLMGNLPIIYDEINAQDPAVLYEYISDFTNGRGRQRATAEGSLRHQKATWQTIMFTASNKSLVETLMSIPENQDAMQFRVIELPVGFDKSLATEGEEIRKQLPKHAGFAGERYLQYLTSPGVYERAQALLPQLYKTIYEKYDFRPEHRYWVRTLSAVALAGRIVSHLGILNCSPDRVVDWAAKHLQGRIGEATVTGKNDAPTLLVRFMDAHQRGKLVVVNTFIPGRSDCQTAVTPTEELVIRQEQSTGLALIAQAAFRQWMSKNGGDWSQFKTELIRERLGTFGTRTLGAGTPFASGQTKVIEVNLQHSAFTGIVAPVIELKPNVTNTRQDRLDQALK